MTTGTCNKKAQNAITDKINELTGSESKIQSYHRQFINWVFTNDCDKLINNETQKVKLIKKSKTKSIW